MKPIGYLPAVPGLRKKLKKGNKVTVELILRKLKTWEASFPGAEPKAKKYTVLNELRNFIGVQLQHGRHVLLREKMESRCRVHGITSVDKLPLKKESNIA